jgi:hypothetical protein
VPQFAAQLAALAIKRRKLWQRSRGSITDTAGYQLSRLLSFLCFIAILRCHQLSLHSMFDMSYVAGDALASRCMEIDAEHRFACGPAGT